MDILVWKCFRPEAIFFFWVLMWNQRTLPPGGSDLIESSSGFRRFPIRVLSSSCGLVCPPVGWGVGEMSCSEAQDFEHLVLRFCFLHRGGYTGKWCFRALPGKADPRVGSVTSLSVLALKTHLKHNDQREQQKSGAGTMQDPFGSPKTEKTESENVRGKKWTWSASHFRENTRLTVKTDRCLESTDHGVQVTGTQWASCYIPPSSSQETEFPGPTRKASVSSSKPSSSWAVGFWLVLLRTRYRPTWSRVLLYARPGAGQQMRKARARAHVCTVPAATLHGRQAFLP